MKLFCLLALVTLVVSDGPDILLSAALSSPSKMVSLFTSFEVQHDRHYSAAEEKMRLKLFQKSVREVVSQNSKHLSWTSAINDFSDKTEQEKKMYLGLNISNVVSSPEPLKISSLKAAPASKSWIAAGGVTNVKNQKSCGSCWAFGAIGALEDRYHTTSGVLRDLSEEQVLDCTYSTTKDGCRGGWMKAAINFIKGNGAVSSTADYPYVGKDGTCGGQGNRNAILGAKINKYVEISGRTGSDAITIPALAQGALSITLKVISSFHSYKSGIYADPYKASFPNHALTAVAYTSKFILVKNSWGSSWGDKGFIKVARNYNGCAMHMFVGYPDLASSGVTDTFTSDPVTNYNDDGGDDGGDDGNVVKNLALGSKQTSQSSNYGSATSDKAVDGNTNGVFYAGSVTHTGLSPQPSWWKVVLDKEYYISYIELHNRGDCCQRRLDGAHVYVDGALVGTVSVGSIRVKFYTFKVDAKGTEVKVVLQKREYLSLAEVRVMGKGNSGDCPGGTVKCPDGVCRHTHMC